MTIDTRSTPHLPAAYSTVHRVAGLVLAGGEGRRMGGQDKGLLPYQGVPLALHAARRLAAQACLVLISANRHLEEYRGFGYPVVQDTLPGFNGPLAGILAAMAALDTLATDGEPPAYLAVVPCDTPHFPADLVPRLLAATSGGKAIAHAAAGGRNHYACALLRTDLAADLSAYLADGGRSLRGWYERHGAATVIFADPDAFANLNSPDSLLAAEALEMRKKPQEKTQKH